MVLSPAVILDWLAFGLFVVMALNDRCACNSPKTERDNEVPSVCGVECHRLNCSETVTGSGTEDVSRFRFVHRRFSERAVSDRSIS